MKRVLFLCLLSFSLIAYSQCTLSSGDYSNDDIKVFLDAPKNCSEIIIPNGSVINMNGKWSLGSYLFSIKINPPSILLCNLLYLNNFSNRH